MTAPTERAAAEVATISKETSSSITIDEKHGPPSEEGVKPTTAALSDHEKQIIDRQTDAPSVTVSYLSLFRYANKKDVLIMIAALVASIASGAVMPLMTLVYGNFAGSFTSFSVDATAAQHFKKQTDQFTLYFVYLGMHMLQTVSPCKRNLTYHQVLVHLLQLT
jgi:ATP-binding cassette subfamily B (MDR/TAP) protein 1